MRKYILLSAILLPSTIFASEFKVIIKNDNSINYETEAPEPEKGISGYLIDFLSINNSSRRNSHDVTKINEPTWEEYYSDTKDMVINTVSNYNQRISTTGVINWFDPDRTYKLDIQEACWSNDKAEVDFEFLDSNDNVLLWFKSRSKGSFGSYLRYGKLPDYSDVHTAPSSSSYPIVNGYLDFDKNTGVVTYDDLGTNGLYKMQDWTFNGVDVKNISKIRVSYANVMSTYGSGTTCGTNMSLKIIEE